MDDKKTILEAQIRECFGRIVWTHKIHEKAADRCTEVMKIQKWCQILTSGVAAIVTNIMLQITEYKSYLAIASAITSAVSAFLAVYVKNFDPGGRAQKHRETANKLWDIRESYLSLLTDMKAEVLSYVESSRLRDALQRSVAAVYKTAPPTDSKSYKKAGEALNRNNEFTFSPGQIDQYIPLQLRMEQKTESTDIKSEDP